MKRNFETLKWKFTLEHPIFYGQKSDRENCSASKEGMFPNTPFKCV